MSKCYLVGRWVKGDPVWHVQGIFDSEDDAVNACVDRMWFVMPTQKNVPLPTNGEVVGYYPIKD